MKNRFSPIRVTSPTLEKKEERVTAQNMEVDRACNLLRKELDRMRRQPQARGTKAKSRINAFYSLEEKAQRRREEEESDSLPGTYIGNKI